MCTEKMSHSEYIQNKRSRVAVLSSGMLENSIDYLEGAIELASLRFEIGVKENDEDFLSFEVIASDIDHLPIGEPRKYWSKEALKRYEIEIQEATSWAKEISLSHCKSLLERFG